MNTRPNCTFCGPRLSQIQARPAHFLKKSESASGSSQADYVLEYIPISKKCPFNSGSWFNREWAPCNYQKGFTALELIVVLIVGMGIIALAASKMDLLFGKANVFEEISNLNIMFANIKNLKTSSGYGKAGANLVPQIISTKGLPQNMSVVDNVPRNLWGKAVTITSTGAGFSISYAGVPQDACIKLATQANRGGAFASVTVNNAAAVAGEYSSAQASTDCRSSKANILTWATNS